MYNTKDLYLDAVTDDGLQELYKVYNDYEIQVGIESTNNFIAPRRFDVLKEEIGDGGASFIVRRHTDKAVIGFCSINTNWLIHLSRPFLYIGKEYRGKGYGKQLVALLMYIGFQEFNARKMAITVYSFNNRAIHLYRAAGFQEEGRVKEEIYRMGQYWDVVYMGLFRKDYREYWKTQVLNDDGTVACTTLPTAVNKPFWRVYLKYDDGRESVYCRYNDGEPSDADLRNALELNKSLGAVEVYKRLERKSDDEGN